MSCKHISAVRERKRGKMVVMEGVASLALLPCGSISGDMPSMAPTKRKRDVIVECRGHNAARFCNVKDVHGWDNDLINMLEMKEYKDEIFITFECETLKSDKAADDHIKKFMPKLAGLGVVVGSSRSLPIREDRSMSGYDI